MNNGPGNPDLLTLKLVCELHQKCKYFYAAYWNTLFTHKQLNVIGGDYIRFAGITVTILHATDPNVDYLIKRSFSLCGSVIADSALNDGKAEW